MKRLLQHIEKYLLFFLIILLFSNFSFNTKAGLRTAHQHPQQQKRLSKEEQEIEKAILAENQTEGFLDSDTSFSYEEKVVLDSVLGTLNEKITDYDRNEIYKSLKTTLTETPLIPLDSTDDPDISGTMDLKNIEKIEEKILERELNALQAQTEQEENMVSEERSENALKKEEVAYSPKLNADAKQPKRELTIFEIKQKNKIPPPISQITTTINPSKFKKNTEDLVTDNNKGANAKTNQATPKAISNNFITKSDKANLATPSWKKTTSTVVNNSTKNYASIDFVQNFQKKGINKKYIREMVNTLSSVYFQGRATRTRGQRISLAFLNFELEHMGYKGPYNGSLVQSLKIADTKVTSSYLKCGSKEFKYITDYYFDISKNTLENTIYNLIFIGKGKQQEINRALEKNYNPEAKNAVIVTPSNLFDIKSLYKHLNALSPKYRIELLVVLNNQQYETERLYIEHENRIGKNFARKLSIDNTVYNKNFISTVFIAPKIWNDIFYNLTPYKKLKEYLYNDKKYPLDVLSIKTQKLTFKASVIKENTVVGNLVAIPYGFNPNKENVIVSANYDGKANTPNANYNATGIATLLSLAKIFAPVFKKATLDKNLIFVFFVGHKQGNLGSKFYTTFPSYPHVKTFMDININGIGVQRTSNPKTLYASCSKYYLVRFDEYIKKINSKSGNYNLNFSVNKNLNYLYNSDAWQFGQINIPFIEFTDSPNPNLHENEKDPASAINYNILISRIEYLSSFLWNVLTSTETSRNLIEKKALIEAINLRK